MARRMKVQLDASAYQEGFEAGRRAASGGPNWFLLILLGGAAYALLRNPERRTQVQAKVKEYADAAQQGKLGEVAQRDLQQAQEQAQQLRDKADQAVSAVKKGQEVGKVALQGAEPAAKLAEDAATVLTSNDPTKVGQAVQDAKANLGTLADVGRDTTKTVVDDSAGRKS